jgi:hypothetical protein
MRGKVKTHRVGAGSFRSLVCLIVLVTFALQSFLVQTHIHNLMPISTMSGSVELSASHQTKAPLDADKCLLCQEYTHSGVYVMPAVAAALPPTVAVSLLPRLVAPFVLARLVSHNWMGRAPPRA